MYTKHLYLLLALTAPLIGQSADNQPKNLASLTLARNIDVLHEQEKSALPQAELNNQRTTLNKQLEDLHKALAAQHDSLQGLRTQITGNQTQIATKQQDIAELSTKNAAHEEHYAKLSQTHTALTQQLEACVQGKSLLDKQISREDIAAQRSELQKVLAARKLAYNILKKFYNI